MKTNIGLREYGSALIALLVAIGLQVTASKLNHHTNFGPQYVIITTEVALAVLITLSISSEELRHNVLQRHGSILLLLIMSVANFGSLVLVLNSLIVFHKSVSGVQLLVSAIAIFLTNIIIYAIWYWEIDSPGFSLRRWTKSDKDFQFTQQDLHHEFPHWRPEFADYLYVSLTNAVNFAPADTRPLTRTAKMLMGSQALISVFTLALVVARSVSILGS